MVIIFKSLGWPPLALFICIIFPSFIKRSFDIDDLYRRIERFAIGNGQFLPEHSAKWYRLADGRNVDLPSLFRLLHATDVRSGSPSTRLLTRLGY